MFYIMCKYKLSAYNKYSKNNYFDSKDSLESELIFWKK